MSYGQCPICNQYGWLDTHHCQPIWHVRHYDAAPKDAQEVRGADAERAAEQFVANNCGDGDYGYTEDSHQVIVRDLEGHERNYEVAIQVVPEFNARGIGEWSQPRPEHKWDEEDDDVEDSDF